MSIARRFDLDLAPVVRLLGAGIDDLHGSDRPPVELGNNVSVVGGRQCQLIRPVGVAEGFGLIVIILVAAITCGCLSQTSSSGASAAPSGAKSSSVERHIRVQSYSGGTAAASNNVPAWWVLNDVPGTA